MLFYNMKIHYLYLLLLGVFVFSMESCKKQVSSTADNDIQFDTIHSVRNYHIDNDSTQPSSNLKVTFIYPKYYTDGALLDSLQEIFISSFLDEHYSHLKPTEAITAYEDAYIENYKQDVNIYIKDRVSGASHDDNDNYFSYYETISNEILFNKGKILSFQVKQVNYKGGATSYEYLKNHTINLETGKLMMEDDIFNSGFEKFLSSIFKDRLMKSNKVQTINDLENLGYFGIDEIVPNNNFYVDSKGITYIFNKGEYSAYQLDAIKIFIPYDELSLVLKENSPISQFIEK